MKPNGSKTGTSSHAVRAVLRVMSDGKPRDFGEIVEAIQDLPQDKNHKGAAYRTRSRQIPTQNEMGQIGKKLGFTATKQTRYVNGIVDGVRVTFSKQVTVYRLK